MIASHWHTDSQDITVNDERRAWLMHANRLVLGFKAVLGGAVMGTLHEEYAQPFADESKALQLQQQPAHIRQVIIDTALGDHLCYARVIIPDDTYHRYAQQFLDLGKQFLGDSLLYNNKDVTRHAFEFACFDDSSIYMQAYAHLLEQPLISGQTWPARRSIFLWQQQPLLITECLLPYLATVPYTCR